MSENEKIEKVKVTQNDVTRPEAGTATGKLWEIADRESNRLGKPAPRKVVTDAYMAEVPKANIATANTQYARWVKFHGVGDLIKANRKAEADALKAQSSQASEQAKAEAAEKKAAKEAEKAAKKAERERVAAEKKAAKEAEKEAKARAKAEAAAAQPAG